MVFGSDSEAHPESVGNSMTNHTRLVAIAASLAAASSSLSGTVGPNQSDPPPTVSLTGVVRDFRERTVAGGHPDFERRPAEGFGQYCKNVEEELGANGKPEYNSCGFKLTRQWKNSAGRNICWLLYDDDLGDVRGDKDGGSPSGGVQSEESFDKWWRDDLATNASAPLALNFTRQSNGTYVFDSNTDPQYASLGGFFPIDGQLLGNSAGTPAHNFHFTLELHTRFTYSAAAHQTLSFRSDDALWVFVNGMNVIDLGGVHGVVEQEVQLNRLGLSEGQDYDIHIFYAERHRPVANLKLTLPLPTPDAPPPPTISAGFD